MTVLTREQWANNLRLAMSDDPRGTGAVIRLGEHDEELRAQLAAAVAERDRLLEIVKVRKRLEDQQCNPPDCLNTPQGEIDAHFPAAEWLLTTDPDTVPRKVWVREMTTVFRCLELLKEQRDAVLAKLAKAVEALAEITYCPHETTCGLMMEHAGRSCGCHVSIARAALEETKP